jgi:hypothetical protein
MKVQPVKQLVPRPTGGGIIILHSGWRNNR